MTEHDEATAVPPLTRAWVRRHLGPGEWIAGAEALHGGITAADAAAGGPDRPR
ncbi:hypothetical protein [Streptomyces sp. 71268]|uniref:hypothetical protein n=1 Tax=Streptomyces sp. 71268 TaxID=3002640 RepID=UPI0032B2895A